MNFAINYRHAGKLARLRNPLTRQLTEPKEAQTAALCAVMFWLKSLVSLSGHLKTAHACAVILALIVLFHQKEHQKLHNIAQCATAIAAPPSPRTD
jgi:hypothetical protein